MLSLLLTAVLLGEVNATNPPFTPTPATSFVRVTGDDAVSDIFLIKALVPLASVDAGAASRAIASVLPVPELAVSIVGINTRTTDTAVIAVRFHSIAEVSPGGVFVRTVITATKASLAFVISSSSTEDGSLSSLLNLDPNDGFVVCELGTEDGMSCLQAGPTCGITSEPEGVALIIACSCLLCVLLWLTVLLSTGRLVPSNGRSSPFWTLCCCMGEEGERVPSGGGSHSSRSGSRQEVQGVLHSHPPPPQPQVKEEGLAFSSNGVDSAAPSTEVAKQRKRSRSRKSAPPTAADAPSRAESMPDHPPPPPPAHPSHPAQHTELAPVVVRPEAEGGVPSSPAEFQRDTKSAAPPGDVVRGRRTPPAVVAVAPPEVRGTAKLMQKIEKEPHQQQQHQQHQQHQYQQQQQPQLMDTTPPSSKRDEPPSYLRARRDVSYVPDRHITHGLMMDSPADVSGDARDLHFSDGEEHNRYPQQPFQPRGHGTHREQDVETTESPEQHQRHPLAERNPNEGWEHRRGGKRREAEEVREESVPPYFDEHERRAHRGGGGGGGGGGGNRGYDKPEYYPQEVSPQGYRDDRRDQRHHQHQDHHHHHHQQQQPDDEYTEESTPARYGGQHGGGGGGGGPHHSQYHEAEQRSYVRRYDM